MNNIYTVAVVGNFGVASRIEDRSVREQYETRTTKSRFVGEWCKPWTWGRVKVIQPIKHVAVMFLEDNSWLYEVIEL